MGVRLFYIFFTQKLIQLFSQQVTHYYVVTDLVRKYTVVQYRRNISLKFSRNTEVSDSEFTKNLEEFFFSLSFLVSELQTNACMVIVTNIPCL